MAGGEIGDWLNGLHVIDGNLKQLTMPFVLDPNNTLYSETNYTTSTSMTPAYFSFRHGSKKLTREAQKLNFCPYSYRQYFDADIGRRLLYSYPANEKKSVTYQEFLNNIPAIQIREFIPDTAIDQCVNLLRDLTNNLLGAINSVKDAVTDIGQMHENYETLNKLQDNGQKVNTMFQDIYPGIEMAVKYVLNYLRGDRSGSGTGKSAIDDFLTGGDKQAEFSGYNIGADNVKAILQLPFMLYYRLQGATTTGIYDVPYIYDANAKMYGSNGNPGWEGDGYRSGFRLADVFENAGPGIGALVNTMFGNIGISWTPWWDAKSGQATPFEDLQVTFDLFNDNAQAALANFLFVNNLVASNKWVQYGLAQHSPHIYDVKIEGQQRMYACSGQFSVNPVGVMRDPPESWINMLCNNHANRNVVNVTEMRNILKANKIIKIPDVYKVTMQFHSLLPDNFNQFVYQYAGNLNHIDAFRQVYQQSGAIKGIGEVLSGLIENVQTGFTIGINGQMDSQYNASGSSGALEKSAYELQTERDTKSVKAVEKAEGAGTDAAPQQAK